MASHDLEPIFESSAMGSTSKLQSHHSSSSDSISGALDEIKQVSCVNSGEVLEEYSTPAAQLVCEPRIRPGQARLLGPPPCKRSTSPEISAEFPRARRFTFARRTSFSISLGLCHLVGKPLSPPDDTTTIVLETATATQNNFVRLTPNTQADNILAEKAPFLAGLRLLLEYTKLKAPPIIGIDSFLDMKLQGENPSLPAAQEASRDARSRFTLSNGWQKFLRDFDMHLLTYRATETIDHDRTWTLFRLTLTASQLKVDLEDLIYELEYFSKYNAGRMIGVAFMKDKHDWTALDKRAQTDLEILENGWVDFAGTRDDLARKQIRAYLKDRIRRVREKCRKAIAKAKK